MTVRERNRDALGRRLSPITSVTPEVIATSTLNIETNGPGFYEFTRDAARFIAEAGGKDGTLLAFVRHTSASLVIQENADSRCGHRSHDRVGTSGA